MVRCECGHIKIQMVRTKNWVFSHCSQSMYCVNLNAAEQKIYYTNCLFPLLPNHAHLHLYAKQFSCICNSIGFWRALSNTVLHFLFASSWKPSTLSNAKFEYFMCSTSASLVWQENISSRFSILWLHQPKWSMHEFVQFSWHVKRNFGKKRRGKKINDENNCIRALLHFVYFIVLFTIFAHISNTLHFYEFVYAYCVCRGRASKSFNHIHVLLLSVCRFVLVNK